MTKQYTPIYALPYPQIGDPVKEGQANMEELAKKIETTLQNGSFPSANPDAASLTARLDALENRRILLALNSSQALTTGAKTAISWNLTKTTVSAFRNGSFSTRVYAPVTGQYLLTGTALLSNVGGGFRSLTFRTNGTKDYELLNVASPSSTYNNAVSGSTYIGLNAGEYVELMAEVLSPNSSVSALGDPGASAETASATRMAMQWVGPRIP